MTKKSARQTYTTYTVSGFDAFMAVKDDKTNGILDQSYDHIIVRCDEQEPIVFTSNKLRVPIRTAREKFSSLAYASTTRDDRVRFLLNMGKPVEITVIAM